jgi:2-polyprenyl-3-methyl-5-hydroxy-6-metoxy-1,4-benzoquinol methylase
MHNTLIDRERSKYEAAWGLAAYATNSPGERSLPIFLDMAHATGGTVIDAGCGAGKGALALKAAGFDVTLCDLTPDGLLTEAMALPFVAACLWDDLTPVAYLANGGKVDYVYCCDVLEHIPTPFTMLVIARLLAVARKGVFLSISTVPDQFGAWVGEPLHQTVQSFTHWRDQVAAIGRLVEARDLLVAGCYYVEPK